MLCGSCLGYFTRASSLFATWKVREQVGKSTSNLLCRYRTLGRKCRSGRPEVWPKMISDWQGQVSLTSCLTVSLDIQAALHQADEKFGTVKIAAKCCRSLSFTLSGIRGGHLGNGLGLKRVGAAQLEINWTDHY